jgi:glutamate dehydrogenase (NADP+)
MCSEPTSMNENSIANKAISLYGRRFSIALGYCPLPYPLLADLVEPKRTASARIAVRSNGRPVHKATAWRICLSDALGPTKGGVRFHPDVSADNLLSLSARILLKCAVNDLPHGGAAGGIRIDPKLLSRDELESLAREYVRAFADVIGSDRDILSPDVGTNAQIMSWMSEELNVILRRQDSAAINGKPLGRGGVPGRHEATAVGALTVLKVLLAEWQLAPEDVTCAIQGLGAAGGTLAIQLSRIGVRVVAASDSSGGWYAPHGLDVETVCSAKRDGKPLFSLDLKEARPIPPAGALEVKADLVIAAALGGQVTREIAKRMQCRAVIEIANAAVMSDAEEILEERGISVVPDLVVNAGGITASHFEWVQNRSGRLFAESEILEQLDRRMGATAARLLDTSKDYNVPLSVAAQIVAIDKLKLHYGFSL